MKYRSKTDKTVFERMADDVFRWTNEAAIKRATTGLSFSSESHFPKSSKWRGNVQQLRMSRSNLGRTILYGNVTHQRNLDMKIDEIEKQKIRQFRNMEWKQLDMFKDLAKDRIKRERERERENLILSTQNSPRLKKKIFDDNLKLPYLTQSIVSIKK